MRDIFVDNDRARIAAILSEIARLAPAAVVEQLVKRLEQSPDAPCEARAMQRWLAQLPGFTHRNALSTQFELLRQLSLPTSGALAWGLRGALAREMSAKPEGRIEAVWSGPATRELRPRRTEQAIVEVIDAANDLLTIASFAVYRVESIRDALLRALDRGAQVRLILETPEASGGKLTHEGLDHYDLPRHGHLELLTWPNEQRPRNQHRQFGSLHLKCAIADESLLFTSSANFTGHAFDLNMEFGVLIRDGGMAKRMQRHFSELIADGVLDLASLPS